MRTEQGSDHHLSPEHDALEVVACIHFASPTELRPRKSSAITRSSLLLGICKATCFTAGGKRRVSKARTRGSFPASQYLEFLARYT
jgi:hypothetical protein